MTFMFLCVYITIFIKWICEMLLNELCSHSEMADAKKTHKHHSCFNVCTNWGTHLDGDLQNMQT